MEIWTKLLFHREVCVLGVSIALTVKLQCNYKQSLYLNYANRKAIKRYVTVCYHNLSDNLSSLLNISKGWYHAQCVACICTDKFN